MFIVEVLTDGAWALEGGEYFMHDGPAITAAKRRHKIDGAARRVMGWPDGPEVWAIGQRELALGDVNANA